MSLESYERDIAVKGYAIPYRGLSPQNSESISSDLMKVKEAIEADNKDEAVRMLDFMLLRIKSG